MAILTNLPGIIVTVVSNGPRDEYVDDSDWALKEHILPPQGFRTSNFVQVIDDAEFRIRIEVTPEYRVNSGLSFVAEVDGTPICMLSVKYEDLLRETWVGHLDAFVKRISSTQVASRPLKFSSITKVDNVDSEQVKKDAEDMASVGEIYVYVHRTAPGNAAVSNFPTPDPKQIGRVSEKALKGQAISHSVGYGAEQHILRPTSPKTVFLDGQQKPTAVFRFKYRSKQALQAELIIPRSPSPDVILPNLNTRDGSGADTAASREARLSSLKSEIAKIKSEEDASIGRKRRGTEGILAGRAYKTSRRCDGSLLVDLTND